MAAATLPARPRADAPALVVRKHHWLVRLTHWLNIPILLGLALSGLSIYWASPVYHHAPDASGTTDYFADIGRWAVRHLPGQHHYAAPDEWFYNHFSLGTGLLASALRLHWWCAYLFMINGTLYIAGSIWGRGYQSLLPRRADFGGVFAMMRYYIGLPFAKLRHADWPHPAVSSKYNSLQRLAYFSVPIMGLLYILTGWAIHKPQQLGWLQALFGGYDYARVWHFWLMWAFLAFTIPHVVLVALDGWDTFRSMVVGWSIKISHPGSSDESASGRK